MWLYTAIRELVNIDSMTGLRIVKIDTGYELYADGLLAPMVGYVLVGPTTEAACHDLMDVIAEGIEQKIELLDVLSP